MKDQNLDQPLDQASQLPAEPSVSARQPSAATAVPSNKRRLLVSTLVGGSAATVLADSFNNWSKPVVESILLPAHAQTTAPTGPTNAKHIISIPAFSGGVDPVEQVVAFVAIPIVEDGAPSTAIEGTFAIDIGGVAITDDVTIAADLTATQIATAFVDNIIGAGDPNTDSKFDGTGFSARTTSSTDFQGTTVTYLIIESVEITNSNRSDYIDSDDFPIGLRSVGSQHADLNGLSVRITHSTDQTELANILANPADTTQFVFQGGISEIEVKNATTSFTLPAYNSGGGDNDDYLQIDGVPIELGSEDLTAAQVAAEIRRLLDQPPRGTIKTSRQAGALPYQVLAASDDENYDPNDPDATAYDPDSTDVESPTVFLQITTEGIAGNAVPALTVQNATYNT